MTMEIEKSNQIKVRDIFSEYLAEKRHRKTPERFAILTEIYDIEGHFDIESLYKNMKNKNYRVSRATLYNTIELLLDCKLIRRHQFGQNISFFEKSLRIVPTDMNTLILLGDAFLAQGHARKAKEKYRMVLNLNKDSGLEKIIKSKIKNISK